MLDNHGLLRADISHKLANMAQHIEALGLGRGGEWRSLLLHVHAQFVTASDRAFKNIVDADQTNEPRSSMLLELAGRQLERIRIQLDSLHIYFATYRDAVARSDIPVGLQHLVDLLMEQIVGTDGDPVIHLNPNNMYSTIDMVPALQELTAALDPPGETFAGRRHPILFNLPALDPKNVLLAPVLAHEVSHTLVSRDLLRTFQQEMQVDGTLAVVQSDLVPLESATPGVSGPLGQQFRAWSSELLCDAIALALTGPSFLFALVAFAPPSASGSSGDRHPDNQDRVAFALELADQLGWIAPMEERCPGLLGWLRHVSSQPVLQNTPAETFLRSAILTTASTRTSVVLDQIGDAYRGDASLSRLDEASHWLAQGVPMVDPGGQALSPWEVVLAGWFGAIKVHGDLPESVAIAAHDEGFNALLVKGIEYSQIVSSWRRHDRAE